MTPTRPADDPEPSPTPGRRSTGPPEASSGERPGPSAGDPARRTAGRREGARTARASGRSGAPRRGGGERADRGPVTIDGVRISSPERVLYADQGLTKLDLARYYASVAERMVPLMARRPLTLVRCPRGRASSCFFQKHVDAGFPRRIGRVDVEEKTGEVEAYAFVASEADLLALVNLGTLEMHTWNARADRLDRPDRMVFDLDPGEDVPWAEVTDAALRMRDGLEELGLRSFAKTTGGKGLHVVVPLSRGASWEQVSAFAKAYAERFASTEPERFTVNMSKAARPGRTFIDYLRNVRGATAVEAYSTRARVGAPVATPVSWDEVGPSLRPNGYTVENFGERLAALEKDPWGDYPEVRQPLTVAMLRQVERS